MRGIAVVIALLAAPCLEAIGEQEAQATEANAKLAANPIRKVVNLLQAMQEKITKEGKEEEDLYEKFMCYCKTNGATLTETITAAQTKMPAVQASIEESQSELAQLKEDLKQHQQDRSDSKIAIEDATAIREKEAAAYKAESSELKANLDALEKAIVSIQSGMAGGFLQTAAAGVIRQLAISKNMMDSDREELMAFLSGTSTNGYVPKSGEIVGILEQIKDDMSKSLADATAQEKAAKESYEALVAAKTKQMVALTKSIEDKSQRVGDRRVAVAEMQNDLSDTERSMLQDQKFAEELQTGCTTKTAEWEERKKTRADELLAIAETIKILNDDDALDLFKKTLSPSFVQVENAAGTRRNAAEKILREIRAKYNMSRPSIDFIALAVQGKKVGFDKVLKMIDTLVADLKEEQVEDDNKKAYCGQQLDLADDKKKSLEQSIADDETAISNAEETLATLKDEIKALQKSIAELDKSVAEASEQRKKEHAEYLELIQSDSEAKQLLAMAKDRLNKFYHPKMPAVAKPVEEPETALVSISVHVHGRQAPPPPPETFGAYTTKSQESNGVMAMIDLLIKDLDKEMTEAKTDEKNSQAEYEAAMSDAAEKRLSDSKALNNKEVAKASVEEELEAHKESKASSSKELMATKEYISSLHADCDWLLKYYDTRKEARAGEIDALGRAKAVLRGADFSFVQRSAVQQSRLRGHQ